MKNDYDKSIFTTYEQGIFFDYFLELLSEDFALGKITSFEDIPVNELCSRLVEIKPYNKPWNLYHFSKRQINTLAVLCSDALKQVGAKRSVKYFIRRFYFDKMRLAFDMQTNYFEPKNDKNGLPAETPIELRDYVVRLFDIFTAVSKVVPKREFITELPTELCITTHNYVEHKVQKVLENIILGKTHKGVNLFAFFFFRIPEHERITQSLLINKAFLRLCHAEWSKLILLEDDKDSLNFQFAALDLICFMDNENKILFDNKLMQYRHNLVEKTIEAALLAEIEKRFV